jgi:hypothetical protein
MRDFLIDWLTTGQVKAVNCRCAAHPPPVAANVEDSKTTMALSRPRSAEKA